MTNIVEEFLYARVLEIAERIDAQLIAEYLEFERLWTDGVCR